MIWEIQIFQITSIFILFVSVCVCVHTHVKVRGQVTIILSFYHMGSGIEPDCQTCQTPLAIEHFTDPRCRSFTYEKFPYKEVLNNRMLLFNLTK